MSVWVDHMFHTSSTMFILSASSNPAQTCQHKHVRFSSTLFMLYFYLLHFSQYITSAAVKVGGADFVSSRCLKEREVADHTSSLHEEKNLGGVWQS
eukprot:scaffold10289_cov75-Skeletonema_marinoi.AAC.4